MNDFTAFPKIARYSREVIVTEKIDGTNASVWIGEDGAIRAAGRNGWLTPERDNFGFAQWVQDNADELRTLGIGRHFGEWWGYKIQRGYGLDHRRFSLFNVARWGDTRPACCHVVPVLWRGDFDALDAQSVMSLLMRGGSDAAPGFFRPEGIVIFHPQAGVGFKKTFEKDDSGKGREPVAEAF